MSEVKDYPPYLDYPKPRKKRTNGDRIRAMMDEELAKKLYEVSWSVALATDMQCAIATEEDWLDRLKQEVEE